MMLKTFTQCSLRCMLAALLMGFTLTTISAQGDNCGAATTISCNDIVTGSTVGASVETVGTCGTSLNTSGGVWYRLTGNDMVVTLTTCNPGTNYDTKLGVFTGACGALVCVGGNDDGSPLGTNPDAACVVDETGSTLNRASTFTFNALAGNDYFILVTGFGTNVGTFELSVSCSPLVMNNDLCASAIDVTAGSVTAGTTVGATTESNGEPFCGTSITSPGVWYTFTPVVSGNYDIDVCGAPYDSKLSIYTGSCNALTCVDGEDDDFTNCGGNDPFITINATAGTTYYILVHGFGGGTGTFNLTISDAPVMPNVPNDFCADAITIACDETVSGTTTDATFDAVAFCGTSNTAPGVWYSFVSDGSTYTASTCNQAGYDTKISVFTGSCGALECVAGNDDGAGCTGFSSEVLFTTTAGETYFILVHGFGTATGDFDLTLTCCAAPMAVCQPATFILNDTDPIVVTVADVDGGSTADCGLASLTLAGGNFDCFDEGDQIVTLTIEDVNGSTSSCDATVTIVNTFMASEIGCIGDVNVTLGDNCSARITPSMVLTGNNIACAGNVVVTVDDTNSDIITGCGDHTYMVEVFEPVGMIAEFRASDWTLTENTGAGGCTGEFANATLTAGSIDLSILWGEEVSASFTAPFDGDLAFNYDFNGADPFFDFLVIDVNGNIIVDTDMAGTGAISQSLLAGQTAIVRIEDDDFCGIPSISTDVTLSEFSFMSDELVLVNTCWGNIFAEDKTDPVIQCPANASSVTLTYDAYQASGNLSAADATLNFNNFSCLNQGFLADGIHNYDVVTFTTPDYATPVDIYTILMDSDWGDGSMFLFQGGFDPTAPCENLIGSSDDAFVPGGNVFDPALRLSLPLQPNTTYTLVLTNWLTTQFGNWTVSIYSDNNIGLTGGDFAFVEVEETRDLICDDIDGIRFTFPQSYIADAGGNLLFTATRNTFFGGNTAALNAFIEKLSITGFPVVGDNCGQVVVTLSDAVAAAGDCGNEVLTRTFTVRDRYNSTCVGTPRTATCSQVLTFRKPTIGDLVFPPFVAPLECDENFAVDANGNPHPSASGFPWIRTALGFHDLDQSYCNIGASYSDEPRITVCEGTYKLRREWNIIDWCNPGGSGTLQQLIKVFDATGPELKGIPPVINVSTSPFGCLANIVIPTPILTDGNGCSSVFPTSYTVLAFGESFFAGGNIADGDVVSAPIGEHKLILCAEDDCGNETCEEYTIVVTDDIEPTASCNDDINVSIGGGDVANGIEGIARLFAADVDEGSNDNCGEVTVEVRRNYWRNETCDASANRWSPWGPYVDFYCCDIDNEITIELRVTDEAGNQNICWQVVTPEDKLNPFCYAPAPVTLTCSDLPLAFPGDIATAYDEDFAATSTMMSAIFGGATGTDNCAVDTIVERTPNIQVNDCGWGSITRRFEAWQLRPEGDANGNGAIDINEVYRSTNSCSQLITITERHDFTIDFPEDADADCGDPDVPTIITTAVGCDVLSVNIGEPVIFSATGDECYKFSITYDVINWCVWDGEYEGLVLPRITEDDGEALPVDRAVEGNERPVVRVVSGFGPVDNNCDNEVDPQPGIQYSVVIDRRHNDRDGDSDIADVIYDNIPGNTPGCIPADQFGRRNYGRYIYTQFVKVYDSTAPVVAVGEYGGPTANCPNLLPGQFGDDDGNCEEAVSIPFSVSDECELFDGAGNLVVSIVSAELDAFAVDANGDGDIKSNEFVADQNVLSLITDNGDGTYVFAGTFPIITNAMGDNVYHAVRVLFEDGCGNQTSETIVFDVIDCKGPAPVCINGLTVTLMPQEDGGCAMAIWASDFEGSPISDCTGQGPELFGGLPRVTKYAIYRAADVEADPNFVPSPDDTGLVLTQDDDASTVVYVYAFDEDGNYDYCETYVLVQQHVDCGAGTGTLSGVIATEYNETIEGVEVSVNGGAVMSMTTNTDGTYSFDLELGGDYSITPYLNANPLNGVSTFDLVLMSKHVLGVQVLDSPYKRIAADINRSGSITTLDMIQLRKLILNIDTQFANNTSWRFVDAAYEFPVPTNPWHEAFPELINENNFSADILDANFVGVKIGDVNGNAQANALAGDDRTLNGQFNFEVENVSVKAGNVYTVAFRGADMASVEGFQGTLNLNGAELVDIEYGVATAENFGMRYAAEGQITTSWNGKATSEDVLFSLVIRPTVDAELSDVINVSSRYTAAEAYGNGNTMNVGVSFSNGEVVAAGFEMFQNTPNPFAVETLIGFNLPQDAEVTLTINDASGRVLTILRGDYAAGYNTINVAKSQIQGATGVLSYTITAGEFTATKTMVAVK